jgi:hypothetical protein
MTVSKRVCSLILAGVLASAVPPLRGQFTAAEIERRAEQEEFLRTAEIVRFEPEGEGVTKPWKLFLRKDGVEHKAVWKNVTMRAGGPPDEWRYEIAAYRLDKLIGLNMVPPVVERNFRGQAGSLSYWAESKYSVLAIAESGGTIQIPEEAFDQTEKTKYILRLWDSLIGNDDRTQQNILYTEDWRMIMIDHSRAFRSDGEYGRRLVFGLRGIKMADDGQGGKRAMLFRQVPRALIDRLKTLNVEEVRAAVGSYLTRREIKAVMLRKELILAEINEMIARDGVDKVLY